MNGRHDPRREKEIFEDAIELTSTEERERFLQEACMGDAALLAGVQDLLRAHAQADGFLAGGVDVRATTHALPAGGLEGAAGGEGGGAPRTEELGDRVGRYRLLEKIGEGGCGIVYMAEQLEPVRRRLALKIVKLGMDTRQVIARFEAERQTLALMDHPNIAKVFDAGATDTGRPYFVMELVRGVRITQFCAERQLTLQGRLGLFVQVCRTIQHAHQRGIIHRDIKPSNVLVTLRDGVPVPKVIDFGIAKATQGDLTDKTLFTRLEQFIGTPAYMSPEQARVQGFDIDTRSDIYSLGVMLYELLTGRTPFDSEALLQRGIEELILTLRDVEPRCPSTLLSTLAPADLEAVAWSQQAEGTRLVHALRGDLDCIVMKCLEKDRSRRYDTVNGLAADIERYLNHEPVLARPPSPVYRFRKAFRRNRATYVAGGMVVSVLVLGVCLATYGFVRVRAERDAAERARIEVQAEKRIAEKQRRLADESAERARQEHEKTRQALARAQVALAEAAYAEKDGVAMAAELDRVPRDLRDTTWDYLRLHADTSLACWDGWCIGAAAHPTQPGAFAVAEAGGRIALLQADTGGRIQDFETTLRQRQARFARGLAISPDGRRLAVGSLGQGGIAIYDLRDGSPLVEWAAPETDRLEYSADGRWLLQSSSADGQIGVWEAETGRLLWALRSSSRALFSPFGEQVVATQEGELVVLDAADGSFMRSVCSLPTPADALAIQPRGHLIVAGDRNGCVHGVDLRDGHTVFNRAAHQNDVRFVAFTGDGSWFLTVAQHGQRQSIHIWDAETGTRLHSILGGASTAESLSVHPLTGEVLVTGHVSKTWPLSAERPSWTGPGGTTAAFFGGNGSYLAGTTGSGVGWFSSESGDRVPAWPVDQEAYWLMSTSADGQVAAAARPGSLGSEVHILRQAEGEVRATKLFAVDHPVSLVRLSPTGDRLLTFVPGGVCGGQFDTVTGGELPRLDHRDEILMINDAAWLDPSRVVGAVTACAARGRPESQEWLVLWDAASGQRCLTETSEGPVNCLAVAPDGLCFAEAGGDKKVHIRDATTLRMQREFRAHDASITALAWHPTRPILASASADLTVKLWGLPSGRCLQELRGSLKPPLTLHFSRGGRRLLSAGTDRTRVWEPKVLQAVSEQAGAHTDNSSTQSARRESLPGFSE